MRDVRSFGRWRCPWIQTPQSIQQKDSARQGSVSWIQGVCPARFGSRVRRQLDPIVATGCPWRCPRTCTSFRGGWHPGKVPHPTTVGVRGPGQREARSLLMWSTCCGWWSTGFRNRQLRSSGMRIRRSTRRLTTDSVRHPAQVQHGTRSPPRLSRLYLPSVPARIARPPQWVGRSHTNTPCSPRRRIRRTLKKFPRSSNGQADVRTSNQRRPTPVKRKAFQPQAERSCRYNTLHHRTTTRSAAQLRRGPSASTWSQTVLLNSASCARFVIWDALGWLPSARNEDLSSS